MKTSEAKRAYSREYNRTHKEAIKQSKKDYHLAHRESHNLYSREYNLTHRAEMLAKQSELRLEYKTIVLTHYGNGKLACVKCGFSDVRALSIDHISGDGYQQRLNNRKFIGDSIYRWLRKHNYPEGYQTLCMNCQWIKRVDNYEHGG